MSSVRLRHKIFLAMMSLAAVEFEADFRQFCDYDIVLKRAIQSLITTTHFAPDHPKTIT